MLVVVGLSIEVEIELADGPSAIIAGAYRKIPLTLVYT